jgi:integrase
MSGIIKNEGRFYMASYRVNGVQRKPSTKTTKRAAAQLISETWEAIELKFFHRDKIIEQIKNAVDTLGHKLPQKELSKSLQHFNQKCQVLLDLNYPVERSLSFREISVEWLASKKSEVAPSTYAKYVTDIQHFLEYLGDNSDSKILDFERAWLSRYQTFLISTYNVTTSTVNCKLKSVKQCLRYCYYLDYTKSNLADRCSPKKKAKRTKTSVRRRAFTEEEFETILKNCDTTWAEVCTIGAFTGQRLGDIVLAEINDFDLKAKKWSFISLKTGREMEVPLRQEVVDVIKSRKSSDKYLFPAFTKLYKPKSKKGDSYQSSRLSNNFRDEVLVPSGFREYKHSAQPTKGVGRRGPRTQNELCFHSIRHMAASRLHALGISLPIVMDIIGHDDMTVHSGYVKTDFQKAIEAVEKL